MISVQERLKIRPACVEDRQKVLSILGSTQFFRPVEMKVAQEVFEDAVTCDDSSGEYCSFVAEDDFGVVGWICFGPAPCTLGTFDIYWLAVEPAKQGCGYGTVLVRFAEERIRKNNGRLVVIETSGSERYQLTRSFYKKNGYLQTAQVEHFYAPGDEKVIFAKYL
jgi:D-alanine-D-alanine ligase